MSAPKGVSIEDWWWKEEMVVAGRTSTEGGVEEGV
jgi:hypothetical protein